MGELIRFEITLAISALLQGIFLTAAYDIFRIFRFFIKHGKLWTGIEDFIFANVSGIIVFAMIFRYNDGILRAIIFVFIIFGIYTYDKTVSKLIMALLKKTLQIHKKKDKMKL